MPNIIPGDEPVMIPVMNKIVKVKVPSYWGWLAKKTDNEPIIIQLIIILIAAIIMRSSQLTWQGYNLTLDERLEW